MNRLELPATKVLRMSAPTLTPVKSRKAFMPELPVYTKDFAAQSAGGKARVTYEATGKTWCVLSGFTAEGAIFYQRVRFSADGDALIAVHFVYPEEDKEEWDPVVERMGKTLRFVDAEGN